ncbi:MAG: hypothetical protein KBS85_04670 [Lachnospiraceae bacterium]|nr:hypothetical protein [Candidatus Merdinaster equi]
MNQDEIILARLSDLASRSYQKNIYTYSDFLSLADVSLFLENEKDYLYAAPYVYGGMEDAERCMIRFGDETVLGYTEEFPICLLRISPLMHKFADDLSHRDFLGALMHLGIEREVLGDMQVSDKEAFLFCKESMSEYICENLNKVKHTSVRVEEVSELPDSLIRREEEVLVQLPSERIDAIIAKLYHVSRDESIVLFREKKVFRNGRLIENNSAIVKTDDVISVRGYGKFCYKGVAGISKKGKLNATVLKYV